MLFRVMSLKEKTFFYDFHKDISARQEMPNILMMLELKYLSKLGENLSNRKEAFVKNLKLLVTAIAPELLEMLNPFANKANKEHFLYIALFPFSVNQKIKKEHIFAFNAKELQQGLIL